jgi:hypothetical protein
MRMMVKWASLKGYTSKIRIIHEDRPVSVLSS